MLDLKKANNISVIFITIVMLVSGFLGWFLTPKDVLADQKPAIGLEKNIPTQFGNWKIDPTISPITTASDLQSKLDELYSEMLSRTYVNSQGERIMLSIAYGRNQGGDGTQVHRPEYCYPAQGFKLSGIQDAELQYKQYKIPTRQLLATSGQRTEPVMYWVTVGETALRTGWERKFTQIKYGLKGTVPDGLLFRVSSISDDQAAAYKLQEQFTNDLLNAVSEQTRTRLIGKPKGK